VTQTDQDLATPLLSPKPSSTRRAIVIGGWIALGLGVASWITVPSVAAIASSQVISYQDSLPILCSDQVPGIAPPLEDAQDISTIDRDETYFQSMELTPDLDCTLRYFVTNNSAIPVEITGTRLTLAGPFASNGILATRMANRESFDIESDDADANLKFRSADTLQPGESLSLRVQLEFNPLESCMSEGYGAAITTAPAIYVSVLGIESLQKGLPGGYGLVGTTESMSGC